MYKILGIYFILETTLCTAFLQNLSDSQISLLNSYKPCIIRTVILENSAPASKDVLLLWNYFKDIHHRIYSH